MPGVPDPAGREPERRGSVGVTRGAGRRTADPRGWCTERPMATSYPTRFENLYDLASLPWFDLRDGRLVVSDPTVPEAVDMHTHLALAFVRPMAVDLHRGHAKTEHYLPDDRAIDLDVYVNRNFTPGDLHDLERDLALKAVTASGMRATHTLPNLVREMGELRVSQSVLLAIDWPALSDNARTWLKAARGERSVVVFGSVHPYTTRVEEKLDEQKAMGARGIKVHPAVQLIKPDAERCIALYRACGARGLPVLFHCGPVDIEHALGRYLSQVRHYEKAIAECPDTTFVLGHSGALQRKEAVALTRRYPNVWLEVSSQSVTGIREILELAPNDRITFGSDWPFYHQAIPLAKVFIATDTDPKLRAAVLYDNAARLLGLPPREGGEAA